MPTYEYRCPAGHDFEKFVQKMSDAQSELPCPSCGKAAARRMSAGGGLVFKGSGFYITDYGKDGKKDQRAAAANPDARTDSGGEAKTSSGDSGSPAPAPAAPNSPTAAPPPSAAKPVKSEKTEKVEKPGKKSGPAK